MIRTEILPNETITCKLRHGPSRVEAKVSQQDESAIVEFLSPRRRPHLTIWSLIMNAWCAMIRSNYD